jgi:uncharacterized DUF497 family protein
VVYKRYNKYTGMEFEFDERKSRANKAKHGIDFSEAQSLWADPDLLEIPATTEGERRYVLIGMVADRLWSVIVTYRNEKIRIISVRRSRTKERELYES